MTAIRRLYIFLVCFISLQAVMGAVNTLFEGAGRWLSNANAPDALFFTFQLAVLIVGGPIFLGHWLWAVYLAQRYPAEREAASRRLYLYLTRAVFVAYLGYGLFLIVSGLTAAISGLADGDLFPASRLIHGLLLSALAGGLWFYHEMLLTDKRVPADELSLTLFQLYMFCVSGASLGLAAIGATGVQQWLLRRWSGAVTTSLPDMAGLLAAGGLLWLYHEWARTRSAKSDPQADNWRTVYAVLVSTAAVLAAGVGLGGTVSWALHGWAGERVAPVPDLLPVFITALLVLIYHELALDRSVRAELKPLRWFQGWALSGGGLLVGAVGLWAGLSWLYEMLSRSQPYVNELASGALPGLMAWLYYRYLWHDLSGQVGLRNAEATGFVETGRWLRRVYVYGFSGLGVGFTTYGLVGVQEWLFTRAGGEAVVELPGSLAALIVGLPLWLLHWAWAERLLRSGLADEEKSDLRKAYLFAIIYLAVHAVIVTLTLLGNGLLRALLDLPVSGTLGLPLAIIVAASALWAYHAFVLRRDIARVGESRLQAGMQRLYWYLVAALGLLATAVGLAGVLSVVVRWLALSGAAPDDLREQLAGFAAVLAAGLPVWLSAWWPAQTAAAQDNATGLSSRQSALRKLYLYAFALIAVVATLASAVTAVFQILNAALNVFGGENLLADIAQSLGFTVIAAAIWIYHAAVLRGDNQWAKRDAAAAAQQRARAEESAVQTLSQQWAALPVAVVDGGDGSFGQTVIKALQQEIPYLKLVPVGLTPQALAGLGVDGSPDAAQQLVPARLIVAAWHTIALSRAVATHPAPKVIVAVEAPGLHWANLNAAADYRAGVVQIVKQLLPTLTAPPELSAANSPE